MNAADRWNVYPAAGDIEKYRAAGLWRNATLADDAERAAAETPDLVLWREGERSLTAAEALAQAKTLAGHLMELGVKPGDVVSFQLPNWLEAVVINLACIFTGAVINPVVPIYRGQELRSILTDSGSKVIFIPAQFRSVNHAALLVELRAELPRLEHIIVVRGGALDGMTTYETLMATPAPRQDFPPRDPAMPKFLMYTSGTTGRAKGVLHSHETNAEALMACARYWGLKAGDRVLMPSPVTHVTGFTYGLEWPLLWGTTTILMDRWDADEAVRIIDSEGVAFTISATPFLVELLAAAERAGTRLPSLRVFGCGGAAVPPEVIHRANTQLAHACAFRIYGSTEAPVVTLGYLGRGNMQAAAETDGRIVGYDVRIVDDQGHDLPDGQDGEIWVRGPTLFLGYSHPDDRGFSLNEQGYFEMGDIGRKVADEGLLITGRKKDIIIRGGENISAKEVEDLLHRHPAVREAAVVSMPHGRLGEGVCAYIIPASGACPEVSEISAYLDKLGLARQKFPEVLICVDDFPRTTSGKIRKDQLRADIRTRLETGKE